jgi:prepilin signal peptidase PulO-like enzyme (type II secretory pathway)
MVLLCALVGLLVGGFLNWASDYLPRYASSSPSVSLESIPQPMPALWHLLTSSTSRRSLIRLQKWSQLGVAVELFTALLFAYLWNRLGLSWELLLLAFICSFFLLVAIIDLRYRLVLNVMVYPAMVVTLLLRFMLPGSGAVTALVGGVIGLALFLLTALLRPGDLGAGDVKLATLIGLILGFPQVLWALALGIVAGGIAAILLILLTHRWGLKSHIPYAPFLCLGATVALLYNPLPLILPI